MKRSDFNIIIFLAVFLLLKEGFYFYVGLTTPGGRLFSPFLATYANIPYWFTVATAKSSKLLLEIGDYTVYQKDAANITISGSRGVTLAWGCLGMEALSVWFAFITAHRCGIKYKLKWIVAGIVLIFIVNTLRIVMIALSNFYKWSYFQSFNAHRSFNTLTYCIIILLMLIFVYNYRKSKRSILQEKNNSLEIPKGKLTVIK